MINELIVISIENNNAHFSEQQEQAVDERKGSEKEKV